MRPKGIPFALVVVTALFVGQVSFAEKVQFPEEELARESVLPVFDAPVSVMNRRVTTAGRGELGLMGGMNLKEAFYSPFMFGVQGVYHLNEVHGMSFGYFSWLEGNSSYADKLEKVGDGSGEKFEFDYLPNPEYLALLNYQYTMYYGKMSLTKSLVFNLSLYGLLGGGVIGFSGDALPTVSAGLGQKFYFTPNFGLRADLRLMGFRGPNILSRPVADINEVKEVSFFEEQTLFYTVLSVGFVYLF